VDPSPCFRALLATAVVTAAAPGALGAEPAAIGQAPVERMIDLNRRAFTEIQEQRFEAAKHRLAEALIISETAGLEDDEMTARTYIHLAAVHLTGFQDRAEALRYFTLALKINPSITISAGLETAALKSAYLEAREEMGLPPNPDADEPEPPPRTQPAETAVPAPAPAPPLAGGRVLDPDPPARVPAPVYCSVPLEIPAEQDLLVRCLTQKQQKRSSATLYYRIDGASTKYAALPMTPSPKGWLLAVIPGNDIRGRALSYYVKAQLPGSATLLYHGYPEAPKSLHIQPPPEMTDEPAASSPSLAASSAGVNGATRRRAPGSVWFALGIGSGVVYHGRETVDTRTYATGTMEPVAVEAGFSPATLLQLEPELGYQLTPRLSLSLFLRYQYAPASGAAFTPGPGQRPVETTAVAGFARAQYLLGGRGPVQGYLAGGVGAGRSFLAVVGKRCAPDRCGLDHGDTVHGGPLAVTAGAGLVYRFSPRLGVFLDAKEIVTLPKAMGLTEFNLGIEVALDFLREPPSKQSSREGRLASRGP